MGQVPARPPPAEGAAAWQWSRTGQTRQVLLTAACQVFAEQGYGAAKMTDIAARAGLSVGSIYHHFGGKSELYLALWRRYHLAREEAADQAVARAASAGVTDSARLWAAGARAILQASWKRRDLAALFCAGNGPPDFEAMRQDRSAYPGRHGDTMLRISDDYGGGLYPGILSAILSEGTRAIVRARTRREADAIIDEVLEYAGRLMAGGPASHAPAPRPGARAGAAAAPATS